MSKYIIRYDIPSKFWYVSGHDKLSTLSNRGHYILQGVEIGIDKSGCYVSCDCIVERKTLRPKSPIAFRYTPLSKKLWQYVNGSTLQVGHDNGKGLLTSAEQAVITGGSLLELTKKVR